MRDVKNMKIKRPEVGETVRIQGKSDYGVDVVAKVGCEHTVVKVSDSVAIGGEIVPGCLVESRESGSRWIKLSNDLNFILMIPKK